MQKGHAVKFFYGVKFIFLGMVFFTQLHSMQDKWAQNFLSTYVFRGDERVLHIGCGKGNITHYISQFVPNNSVYGNDTVWALIQAAKRTYPAAEFTQLSFAVKSAEDIEAQDLYDIVFSCCHLHNFSQASHINIVQKICSSLVPGGKMIAIIPGNDSTEFFAIAQQLSESEKWAPFFSKFTPPGPLYAMQDYEQYLFNAGFSSFSYNKIVSQEKFENDHALLEWMRQNSWYVQHLSKNEDQEAFVNDVMMLMDKSNIEKSSHKCLGQESNPIQLTFSRYEVIAQK